MPTYEYRCPEGHEFEHFYKKISDAQSELPCPECGKTATRHISAGAGFLFKGSGFYLTDYGKNAHRKSGGAESKPDTGGGSESGGAESKSETKSESKSESKSDTKPAEPKAPEKPANKSNKAGE